MNLQHIKYALEIAKTGSINKAAENLFMGQPNLSRAIKELEASLGVTVFERSAKGMVPTPEGEQFLGVAKRIIDQLAELESLYSSESSQKQKFSVSVPRVSYISDAFARFVSKIDRSIPLEIFYEETNSLRAMANILQSEFKLGILRYADGFEPLYKAAFEEKGLYSELVTKFRYVLIMSKDCPLAKLSQINFDDLKNYTEIAHADPFVPNLSYAAVKKEELPETIKSRIFVYERASQFELLSSSPDTFMWVSPVPQKLLDRYGLVQLPCRDNTKEYKDVLIYRSSYKLSKLDKAFIDELHRAKNEHFFD